MAQHIGALTLLVADYDQAIAFFFFLPRGSALCCWKIPPLDEPGKPGKRWDLLQRVAANEI